MISKKSLRFPLVVLAIGVIGYTIGGGLYLRDHRYQDPYVSWTFQQIQTILWFVQPNHEPERTLQNRLARITASTAGWRAARFRREVRTNTAFSYWDYHHWSEIRNWVLDQRHARRDALLYAAITSALSAFIIFLIFLIVRKEKETRDRRQLNRSTKPLEGPRPIRISGISIPHSFQPRHILATGSTGVGKTVLIESLIKQFRTQGWGGVIIDFNGESCSRNYRQGDIILNPFDRRSAKWSMKSEVEKDFDLEHLLNLFLPVIGTHPVHDHFQLAGQSVLDPVLRKCKTNLEIWETLSEQERLASAVKQTVAQQYVDPNTKSAGDTLTTLLNAIRSLSYLPADAGENAETFSIRQFIRRQRLHPGPFLWIIVPERMRRALTPLLSVWAGLAISEVISLPPSDNWRIFISTDELAHMRALADFDTGLTVGRKHGLCVLSAVQSISQITEIYGKEKAQTILSCFRTKLILNQGDPDSAEYFSRYLGDQNVTEKQSTISHGHSGDQGTYGKSFTEQIRIKRSVLARELMELPDLTSYLSIGPYSPAKVKLKLSKQRRRVIAPFVARRANDMPNAGEALRLKLDTNIVDRITPDITRNPVGSSSKNASKQSHLSPRIDLSDTDETNH